MQAKQKEVASWIAKYESQREVKKTKAEEKKVDKLSDRLQKLMFICERYREEINTLKQAQGLSGVSAGEKSKDSKEKDSKEKDGASLENKSAGAQSKRTRRKDGSPQARSFIRKKETPEQDGANQMAKAQ